MPAFNMLFTQCVVGTVIRLRTTDYYNFRSSGERQPFNMLSHFCITNEVTAVILNMDKKHQPSLAQKFFRGEDANTES